MTNVNRKMIKLEHTDFFIRLYTYQKGRGREGQFALFFDEVKKLLEQGTLTTFDGYHSAQFSTYDGIISAQLRWYRNSIDDIYTSYHEWVEIPVSTMQCIYDAAPETVLRVLDSHDKPTHTQVIFNTGTRLHEVLTDKTTRHKFIKAVMNSFTHRQRGDRVTFYSDFVEKSFYFEETAQGQRVMNGGLIWHGDRYGVHT